MYPSSNGLMGGSKSFKYGILNLDAISQVVCPDIIRNEWNINSKVDAKLDITTTSKEGNVKMLTLNQISIPVADCNELLIKKENKQT